MSACCRVLVVGGGITSALTTSIVAESFRGGVVVWDKARGAGGRMTTSKSPTNPQCKVDLGAQYVSSTPANQCLHQEMYSELVNAGVLVNFDPKGIQGFRGGESGTKHYYSPDGMSSLVKHFFNRSGAEVIFNQHVVDITKEDGKWRVLTEQGLEGLFEAVVLTLPVPQLLDLQGDIAQLISQNSELKQNLESVQFSSRFALGLFFDRPVDLGVDWTSNYIKDHPIFRYVAIDNVKRGDAAGPTSVIAHTSVPYGMENREVSPESKKEELLSSLRDLFPAWPQPVSSKCLKWKFSQVSSHYPGAPGHIVLNQDPLLVLAGDAYAGSSNFDGCANSAQSAARFVINNLK